MSSLTDSNYTRPYATATDIHRWLTPAEDDTTLPELATFYHLPQQTIGYLLAIRATIIREELTSC